MGGNQLRSLPAALGLLPLESLAYDAAELLWPEASVLSAALLARSQLGTAADGDDDGDDAADEASAAAAAAVEAKAAAAAAAAAEARSRAARAQEARRSQIAEAAAAVVNLLALR